MKTDKKAPTNCAACGHKPTPLNKLVKIASGKWIHKSHISDPNSGFYKAK
jgi:hypothetical protein